MVIAAGGLKIKFNAEFHYSYVIGGGFFIKES
jgi:hypothetical protein